MRWGQSISAAGNIHVPSAPMFTSVETEFVSAYQIVEDYKVPNDVSLYEALIRQAASLERMRKKCGHFWNI